MGTFNFAKFIGKLKLNVQHDHELSTVTEALEQAWEEGDHTKVVESARALSERSDTCIKEFQRKTLIDIQEGKHKCKKKKGLSHLKREAEKHKEYESGQSDNIKKEEIGTAVYDFGTKQAEDMPNIERKHNGRQLQSNTHIEQENQTDDSESERLEVETEDDESAHVNSGEEMDEKQRLERDQQLTSLQTENERLRLENADHLQRERSLKEYIRKYEEFEKDAEQEIKDLETMNAQLKSDKEQIKTKAKIKVKNQKELLLKTTRDLEEKLSNLKRDLQTLEDEKEQYLSKEKGLREEILKYKKNEKSAEQEINNLETKNEKLKSDKEQLKTNAKMKVKEQNEELLKTKTDLEKRISNLEKDVQTLEDEKKQCLSSAKTKAKEQKELLIKTKTDMGQRISNLENDVRALEEEREQYLSNISDLKANMKNKQLALERSKTSLSESEEIKDELLMRLSQVAGAKLTHNNPNIADLSDVNRPTKLAEKYSELYDNEWTDAFASLENAEYGTEETRIEVLFTLLSESFEVCITKANEQMQCIKSIVLYPAKMGQKSTEQKLTFTEAQENMLNDLRKQTSDISHRGLAQVILEKHANVLRSEAMKKYVQSCTELCWKMVIQTPPLHMDITDKKNKTFNKDIFKAYTATGKYVSFVVWPPLYLHEGGSLLCKGTAQGTSEKVKRK